MINPYHELHVSCARSLSTSSRNLFTEISSWDDTLSKSDTVVLQENNLEAVPDNGVIVHNISNCTDEANNALGHVVARCSLENNEGICEENVPLNEA